MSVMLYAYVTTPIDEIVWTLMDIGFQILQVNSETANDSDR